MCRLSHAARADCEMFQNSCAGASKQACCLRCMQWGVAFQLTGTEEQQQQTVKYLEWREKQYDLRTYCDIYTAESPDTPVVHRALVYIASDSPGNVNWLGPAPLEAIAQQIANAVGPSGSNHEYLFRLADFMREVRGVPRKIFCCCGAY